MNLTTLRSLIAMSAAVLLTACGAGQPETQAPLRLAAAVQSAETAPTVMPTAAVADPALAAARIVVSPNQPAPDCAPEGCSSLRIIDGNAEAYRIDAQRRAALEAAYGS